MNSLEQLNAALEEAWGALETKQVYLQNAVDSAVALQHEVDELKAAAARVAENQNSASDSSSADPILQASLHEAWAELEKKQAFLESSFDEIRARDAELDTLRQQLAETNHDSLKSQGVLAPNMDAALKQAWQDLEARDLQILDLSAKIDLQNERIEWLVLENSTLSNAIGINQIRQ